MTGGSEWARSCDGGRTWSLEGTLLPAETNSTNALKLSLSADNRSVYAYGSRYLHYSGGKFGESENEAIFCKSSDEGRSWSSPRVVPMLGHKNLEISHGILCLKSGRLLAPAATLVSKKSLGKKVLTAISDDGGKTWPCHSIVFHDPQGKKGYLEQKLAQVNQNLLIATSWTVTLSGLADKANTFVTSQDDGLSWSEPISTGINGQTMTPIPLDANKMLVLYNRRYGDQGIVMNLVTLSGKQWKIHYEGLLYDPGTQKDRPNNLDMGVDEFDSFQFGFPTAIRLHDNTLLATHWSFENNRFGIRWARLEIDW